MNLRLVAVVLFGSLAACSSATTAEAPMSSHESASTTKDLEVAKLPAADDDDDASDDDTTPSSSVSGPLTTSPAAAPPAAPPPAAPPPAAPPPISKARALAARLGAPDRFLVGLGNDPNGNGAAHRAGYELGSKIDLHYMYLSGLGWPAWSSPAGAYVGLEAAAARDHGAIPMFTLYQSAEHGDGNLAPFATDEYMTQYWANVRLLFQELDAFGDGAIVHVEPDFWGYAQKMNGAPKDTPVRVASLVPECKDLPNDVSGFGKCIVRLSRKLAPKVAIGFSASAWGATKNGVSQPDAIADFMKAAGAADADLLVIETLDRDAGCFEAATDPNCQRSGSFYWSEQDFADHLAWAKKLHDATDLPLLWWQMPLGVPSSTPGTASHYRDHRVEYLFAHPDRFADAGGLGAVFGTGAANQTTVETDGGQFKRALAGYLAKPVALR